MYAPVCIEVGLDNYEKKHGYRLKKPSLRKYEQLKAIDRSRLSKHENEESNIERDYLVAYGQCLQQELEEELCEVRFS